MDPIGFTFSKDFFHRRDMQLQGVLGRWWVWDIFLSDFLLQSILEKNMFHFDLCAKKSYDLFVCLGGEKKHGPTGRISFKYI